MLQDPRRMFSFFGFLVWGDLGPLTMYRSKRGKIVAFAKTWPAKPPSELQSRQRAAFKKAADKWHTLTPKKRERWELATRRLSLPLTGYDLWMHHRLQPDETYVRTIEQQTSLELID